MRTIDKDLFASECKFKTSRSGGKGGQNVNKVETKVELLFNINASSLFSDEEKILLKEKLFARLNEEGLLQVVSSEERSQLQNKERAVEKAIKLIEKALKPVKKRKPTKPTIEAIQKRLSDKQLKSVKKQLRKQLFDGE